MDRNAHMALTQQQTDWYLDQISRADPDGRVVKADREGGRLRYSDAIRSDRSRDQPFSPEEFVHALTMCLLASPQYGYKPSHLYHERATDRHGSGGSADSVDLTVGLGDDPPFAAWEMKAWTEWGGTKVDRPVRDQLYGSTRLLPHPPGLFGYGSIEPRGEEPVLSVVVIDTAVHPTFQAWCDAGRPSGGSFPAHFGRSEFQPYVKGSDHDLDETRTAADLRAIADRLHDEFFADKPDTDIFTNLVKCLLAKIYDERETTGGQEYRFQIGVGTTGEEDSAAVFEKVADLYKLAYARHVAGPDGSGEGRIDPDSFKPSDVKSVVRALQGVSLTGGAARNGDVVGTFFDTILRGGFKQSKGMYFTHANIVAFMVEAVGVGDLAVKTWLSASGGEDRLPMIVDPSCGSGAFLVRAMRTVTEAVTAAEDALTGNAAGADFFTEQFAPSRPNRWAKKYLCGMDPKFNMAIAARVNMVLHGDGSAHLHNRSAVLPLNRYDGLGNAALKAATEPDRSVKRSAYAPEVAETFDVVLTNPPFGVTLGGDDSADLGKTFSLKKGRAGNEVYFLERWCQLLKPGGRLAAVVPESLLNTPTAVQARLFLFRMFHIRAIVSLPRNLFEDTPTATSILFAQKKTGGAVAAWDAAWDAAGKEASKPVDGLKKVWKRLKKEGAPADRVVRATAPILEAVCDLPLVPTKAGKGNDGAPRPLRPTDLLDSGAAVAHFEKIVNSAPFKAMLQRRRFAILARKSDERWPTYAVDEVGYKLSKRREQARPNQLCRFASPAGETIPNLNIFQGRDFSVVADPANPETVLDYMRKDVQWT